MQPYSHRPFGPYSKKYMALSHIAESKLQQGARVDLTVHPMLYNGGTPVPNVTYPCGWHPWRAAPDGSFFSFLYQLDPRSGVTATVAFFELEENTWAVRTKIKNKSSLQQNLLVNHYCGITYPTASMLRAVIPAGGVYVQAQNFSQLTFAKPRPWDHLTPDGLRRGQFANKLFCEGWGLGAGSAHPQRPDIATDAPGRYKGDYIAYHFVLPQAINDAVLCVRYRTTGANSVPFSTNLGPLTLPASEQLCFAFLPVGSLPSGTAELALTALGSTCGAEFDFFSLLPALEADSVGVVEEKAEFTPVVTELAHGTAKIQFPGTSVPYTLTVLAKRVRQRNIPTGCLEDALPSRLSNADPTFDDVLEPFTASFARKHSDEGFYTDLLAYDLYVPAKETHTLFAVWAAGETKTNRYTPKELEKRYQQCKAAAALPAFSADGQRYQKTTRLLRTALLHNVVYPRYRRGSQIIHHTPGKRWDCFYTWDSGFIGLGFSKIHRPTAEFILDSYLSEPENDDFAFVHHGSIVPVQFYLFWELLQTAEDPTAFAVRYYPGLKRYYHYLLGAEGSTMAKFKSGLLTNYDYFYNASGMDDYPAQVLTHQKKLSPHMAPVLLTAHALRAAKMLRAAAGLLKLKQDEKSYSADIERLSAALQTAWDEDCGYFSYTLHNTDGTLQAFLRTETGENANKGMDGVMALVGGGCTPKQKKALTGHIFSPKEMLTPYGITAVDQSAGYFRDNGYWNGTVWFSHQWLLWKSMLDLGLGEKAWQIARTALEAWRTETGATLNTFELLQVATGRGGWFHQFGGLSAPILLWAYSYFVPGNLSAGLGTRLWGSVFAAGNSACSLHACTEDTGEQSVLCITLSPSPSGWLATINGKEVPCIQRTEAAVELMLPPGQKDLAIQLAPR